MLRHKIYLWILFPLVLFACNSTPKEFQGHLLRNGVFSYTPLPEYSVVFFVSSDCPLCKAYRPMIRAMSDSFLKTPNWKVFVFHEDEPADARGNYSENYGAMQFHDPEKRLAKMFKASTTPEVFVVDSASRILYHGAIDNYAIETGKHRPVATEHYLKDAIHALRNGKEIELKSTAPVGCYIE